jgi:phenylalanyl-tRNA synthetase alpha chain
MSSPDSSALIAELESLASQFETVVAQMIDEPSIRAAQAQFLGKKGRVSELMKELPKVPPALRPEVGAASNKVKQSIETRVEARLAELAARVRLVDLQRSVDLTLPARPAPAGHMHILSQVRNESIAIFAELGFVVAHGPQIDTDWHTFEALAITKDHPARDMQDTFYIDDDIVLRTHTSPVQIRTMMGQKPPIRIIAPGHVYRRDDDPTHSPMFTQLECLLVDEGVSFADLKGVLLHYVRRFFKRDLSIRLRPSYFPFVEPGAEVDMECSFCAAPGASSQTNSWGQTLIDRDVCRVCKSTGWVEIGGAGMVDPEVFANVGIDSERYTGFAFGMGIERMAMLRHGINDIKYYYEGDVRFLQQF